MAGSLIEQGVQIAYVCDVDDARAAKAKQKLSAPEGVSDMRKIFDDKAVDMVVVAVPDHWHAPAAVAACAAGKHVYSEKPCSHNIREGRLMVEAARKHKRVMQIGTQSRSTSSIREAVQRVREGAIGEVLSVKAWNSQKRADIGRLKASEPPKGFDYDTWVGPAPFRPFQRNCHHYTWHWWYDFGTGDAGNDGIHEMDICRMALGVEEHPNRCLGYGAKQFFQDDQQFPDTQYVAFEWDPAEPSGRKKTMIYEQRIWTPYKMQGFEDGCCFFGTEGYMLLCKIQGWKLFAPRDKLVEEKPVHYSIPEHTANFLGAIREGTPLNADVEIGHRSTTLIHLANIVARVGRGVEFDPKKETVLGDDEANAFVGRTYREGYWASLK